MKNTGKHDSNEHFGWVAEMKAGETPRRGDISDKPHLYWAHGFWNCRSWMDQGHGVTPQHAYMEMVINSDERERNRRCF